MPKRHPMAHEMPRHGSRSCGIPLWILLAAPLLGSSPAVAQPGATATGDGTLDQVEDTPKRGPVDDPELQEVPRLEVELTGGEFPSWGSEKVIYKPQVLRLAWGESLPATGATWRLVSEPFPTGQVLGFGITSTSGSRTFFQVDLRGRIPPDPPATPREYYIRVVPHREGIPPTSTVKIVYKRNPETPGFTDDGLDTGPPIVDHGFPPGTIWAPHEYYLDRNIDQWMCFLSKVSGTFRGGGERLRVRTDSTGEWVLDAQAQAPQEPGMSAKVTCVRWSLFHDLPRPVAFEHFAVSTKDDEEKFCFGDKVVLPVIGEEGLDCYLNGIGGVWKTSKERGGVSGGSELRIEQCEEGFIGVWATCVDVPRQEKSFRLVPEDGVRALDLVPVNTGVCMFQWFQGELKGEELGNGLERVATAEIVRSGDWWKLIVLPWQEGEDALQVDVSCWSWATAFPPHL